MLGNEAPLWVALLAAMKLGAVVIPTSTLLSGSELEDRLTRGAVRLVIAAADLAGRFPEGDWTGVAVGGRAEGWLAYDDAAAASADFAPDAETRAGDPLLLYFTSGTTSRPKLVLHSHVSYPVGHLSTLYWLGLHARRPPPEHLVSRLGQARLELRLHAVVGRGERGGAEPGPLRRRRGARPHPRQRHHHLLRTADGLAADDPARSGARPPRSAS